MSSALAATEAPNQAAEGFPVLQPILVAADDDDVERLLRTARASVARLALEVRTALRDALEAEREAVDTIAPVVAGPGPGAAMESTVREWIDQRRAALATEIEAARLEAAQVVVAAAREAALIADERVGLRDAREVETPPVAVDSSGDPAPTVIVPAVVTPAPVGAAVGPGGTTTSARRAPAVLAQLLYVDVLLPLVAVVVVLVVLLAWVG